MNTVSEIANAIVLQACEDYRNAIRGEIPGNVHGKLKNPDAMLKDVMKFFQSDWYALLTEADYHYLLEKLDAEWEEGKRLIKAGIDVDCPKLRKHYEFKCPLCGGVAETYVLRHRSPKRNDGSRTITYHKMFECKCHRTERILLKQEIEEVI